MFAPQFNTTTTSLQYQLNDTSASATYEPFDTTTVRFQVTSDQIIGFIVSGVIAALLIAVGFLLFYSFYRLYRRCAATPDACCCRCAAGEAERSLLSDAANDSSNEDAADQTGDVAPSEVVVDADQIRTNDTPTEPAMLKTDSI